MDAVGSRDVSLPAAGIAAQRDALRDTQVDGAITLDAAGRPVADRAMRRLFDYFLIRIGERDLAGVRSDVQQHLRGQLAPAALAQVMAWFDAYVSLQRESAALGATDDLQADLQRRHELRRKRLGDAMAEAWFGEEERDAAYAIARRAVLRDPALDAASRKARLATLAKEYGRDEETDAAQLAIDVEALLDARQASASQRFAEREAMFGKDAAQRLADLDASRAQWNARIADFRARRDGILAHHGLSEAQRKEQVDALLSAFTPEERPRVLVLAGAAGGSAP